MFEQSFVTPTNKTRKAWTTVVSFTAQVAFVLVAILVPLLYPDAIPRALLSAALQAPAPPPPPPPLKLRSVAVVSTQINRVFTGGQLVAPAKIPDKIRMIDETDLPAVEMSGEVGVPGGTGVAGAVEGVIGSVARSVPTIAAPPPPTPAPKPPERKQPDRIRQGGKVQEALIMRRVMPVYPVLAKQARIQGTVRLLGVIATDGTIQQLQVVSGHPLLVGAALEAVRQWVYRPTLLNGDPVEVVAPIDVNFILSQ
jgi:protein TonB